MRGKPLVGAQQRQEAASSEGPSALGRGEPGDLLRDILRRESMSESEPVRQGRECGWEDSGWAETNVSL